MGTFGQKAKKKSKPTAQFTNNELRSLILRYLYDRNCNATSARSDKTGCS